MSDVEVGQMTLTAKGLAHLMKITGETEDQVRMAAIRQGFVVEDLPAEPETGLYL